MKLVFATTSVSKESPTDVRQNARLAPYCRGLVVERARPGELLHLDVTKLGRILRVEHRITGQRTETHRGAGWEYVHVAIDDTSWVAYAKVLTDESGDRAARLQLAPASRQLGR